MDPQSEEAGRTAQAGPTGAAIDVVIVNWNSGNLLRACIAALIDAERTGPVACRIIVVDNASGDGSADGLPQPEQALALRRNSANAGFARACNQGAALGNAPVILFLNPDTQVEPDSLGLALRALLARAQTGIVGAQLRDESGTLQGRCARRPTAFHLIGQDLQLDRLLPGMVPSHFLEDWDHAESRRVDQVMGAFLMIRRTLFEELGGFDERFFVYYDDVDLCARAIDAGYDVRHVAEAKVWHRGQGTTDRAKAQRLFYILRSRVLYGAKHHGYGTGLALLVTALAAQIPMRLVLALRRRSIREAGTILRAAWLLARAMPGLLVRPRASSGAIKGVYTVP